MIRPLLLGALSLSASACSGSLFDSSLPAPVRYVIAPPAPRTTTPANIVPADLAIGRPDVGPGLDTEQVAVVRGHELDYYRGALWGGTVTETVQTFLVAAFQDQKLFRSVAAEQSRIAGDYLLDVEVRDFQAEYTGADPIPGAHVTLICRLVNIHNRKMVDTISVTATQRASENRMATVAAAFETAMQQVSLELTQRTAELVARDHERASAAAASP